MEVAEALKALPNLYHQLVELPALGLGIFGVYLIIKAAILLRMMK